jgi:hypothetical protein
MITAPSLVDALAGQDVDALRERLRSALCALGWDDLLGKQRDGEQTLLEHCLAVFDTLCACAPFFAAEARPALTQDEFVGMLLAAVAHDAGKVAPAFQAYLRGESASFAEHVDPEQIRKVVLGGRRPARDRPSADVTSHEDDPPRFSRDDPGPEAALAIA